MTICPRIVEKVGVFLTDIPSIRQPYLRSTVNKYRLILSGTLKERVQYLAAVLFSAAEHSIMKYSHSQIISIYDERRKNFAALSKARPAHLLRHHQFHHLRGRVVVIVVVVVVVVVVEVVEVVVVGTGVVMGSSPAAVGEVALVVLVVPREWSLIQSILHLIWSVGSY